MRRRALSRALIALGLLGTVTAAAGVAGSSALAVAPAAARGLTVGFAADNSLLDGTAATRSVWLDRAVAEGARIVRVPVVWSEVAPLRRPAGFRPQDPGSPGYNWSSTDETVRELSQHGLTPLLMILSAPTWAEGAHRPALAPPGTWEPNAGQFASFARAAAQRYSGAYPDPLYGGESLPRVRYWQAWNEPNLALLPQPAMDASRQQVCARQPEPVQTDAQRVLRRGQGSRSFELRPDGRDRTVWRPPGGGANAAARLLPLPVLPQSDTCAASMPGPPAEVSRSEIAERQADRKRA